MHQPHVVILESRRFPDVTEQWYNVAVSALTQQGITHSRVTVPNSADLPIALQMLLRKIHLADSTNMRIPDGYLILGLNCKGDIPEENHHHIWNTILDMTANSGVPSSSVVVFEREIRELNNTAFVSKVQLAVQSLVNLMMLQNQLLHPPIAAAA